MYKTTQALTAIPDQLPVMLTTRHVASILNVSDKHARDLCREGRLDGAVKVGETWRVGRDVFLSQFGLN